MITQNGVTEKPKFDLKGYKLKILKSKKRSSSIGEFKIYTSIFKNQDLAENFFEGSCDIKNDNFTYSMQKNNDLGTLFN